MQHYFYLLLCWVVLTACNTPQDTVQTARLYATTTKDSPVSSSTLYKKDSITYTSQHKIPPPALDSQNPSVPKKSNSLQMLRFKSYHGEPRSKNLKMKITQSNFQDVLYLIDTNLILSYSGSIADSTIIGYYDFANQKAIVDCKAKYCKKISLSHKDTTAYTITKLIEQEMLNGYPCSKYKITRKHPKWKHTETQFVWTTKALLYPQHLAYVAPPEADAMPLFNPHLTGFPIKIDTPICLSPEVALFGVNPSELMSIVYELSQVEVKPYSSDFTTRAYAYLTTKLEK